jgi:hypothetical protein
VEGHFTPLANLKVFEALVTTTGVWKDFGALTFKNSIQNFPLWGSNDQNYLSFT